MIPVPSGVRVWLVVGRTDMRRGMNGLALQVQEALRRDPHAGDLFVFRGARGDLIKIIWHDGLGMSLYAKRLEKGRFIWPSPVDGVLGMLSPQLLELLRDWWHVGQPQGWLFPGRVLGAPLTTRQLNRACHAAAQMAELEKPVSLHTLRHNAESRIMPSNLALPPRSAQNEDLGEIDRSIILGIIFPDPTSRSRRPAADHPAGRIRPGRRVVWSWRVSSPSMRGWRSGKSAWFQRIHVRATEQLPWCRHRPAATPWQWCAAGRAV